MKPEFKWPAIIVGALTVHALAWVAVAVLATSNPSYAVEEDYYDKAVAWDAKRHQDAVNADLGWTLDATVIPATSPGGPAVLTATLVDRSGEPVDDAAIAVEAFHNARADLILHAQLGVDGGGRYTAELPMRRNGRWELRFTAQRGSERFTSVVVDHFTVTP
jgi:nitrogen fixation protein FixH